jgi:hypothetical protein
MSRSAKGNIPDLSHSMADHPMYEAMFSDVHLRAESG